MLNTKATNENNIEKKIQFDPWEWVVMIGLIALIIGGPYLFTQYQLGPSFLNTGQIGDTIGGITAPFVNLLAAFLVFKSFTAQIIANKQQRIEHDIQMNELRKDRRSEYLKSLFDQIEKNFELTETHNNVNGGQVKSLINQLAQLTYKLRRESRTDLKKSHINSHNSQMKNPLNSIYINLEAILLLCNEVFGARNLEVYSGTNLEKWYRHRLHTLFTRNNYINLKNRIEKLVHELGEENLKPENIVLLKSIYKNYEMIYKKSQLDLN